MKPIPMRAAAGALLILLAAAGGLFAHKTVILTIDGRSERFTTFAITAGQLLNLKGIALAAEDRLSHRTSEWLREGQTVTLDRAVRVTLLADGRLTEFTSALRNPEDLLASQGIELQDGDIVKVNGEAVNPKAALPPAPGYAVQVIRAVEGKYSFGGESQEFDSTAATAGEALWERDIRLREGDRTSIPLARPLPAPNKNGGGVFEITVEQAQPLVINHQGGSVHIRSTAETVGEALAEAGLALQGLDYSVPAPEEKIPANGEIRLVRVQERVNIEQTPIEFESEFVPAPEVELDTQEVLQPGEYGLNATRVRVRYEDGEEVSRQVETQWVSREPVNRVVGYGTKIVMHTTTTSDGATIQYWRALQMYATSYRPRETSNRTASGMPLKKGVAAVDTNYIAFGTQMYVPGYGHVVAADRGGGVRGRWIDLGYSNEDYVGWHQWVTVYFLWPPPPNIVWVIP